MPHVLIHFRQKTEFQIPVCQSKKPLEMYFQEKIIFLGWPYSLRRECRKHNSRNFMPVCWNLVPPAPSFSRVSCLTLFSPLSYFIDIKVMAIKISLISFFSSQSANELFGLSVGKEIDKFHPHHQATCRLKIQEILCQYIEAYTE